MNDGGYKELFSHLTRSKAGSDKGHCAVSTGSASDFPAIAAMHLLTETAQRAARAISFQHTSMVFTLGEIKAAITLLESGRATAALEVLKRAHAHGCEEMDSGPFPLPNVKAQPRGENKDNL